MANITITRQASADLKRIWRYIAFDNKAAATKLLLKIDQKIAQLNEFPASGSLRVDIRENCRMLVVSGYRVLYEFNEANGNIEVVAVVEPYRDLDEVL